MKLIEDYPVKTLSNYTAALKVENRPIPRLYSLDEKGRLKIGFDQKMNPPIDPDVIPKTSYVLIEDL